MSTTPTVLGSEPLEYTDPNSGKQVSIPLSALFFDPKNNNQLSIDPTKWPDPNTTPVTLPPFIPSMLKNLVQEQLILPAPSPAPKQAMIITATDPGSAGNGITVTVTITTTSADPTQTIFTIKIDETDTYAGLTPATMVQLLGTDKTAGTKPGLVHVVQASLPAVGLPALAAKQQLNTPVPKPATAQSIYQTDLMNNAATPARFVTLEAKKKGPDGNLIFVTISNVTSSAFDLTASWTKTVTGITLPTLQASLANLAYEVGALTPPGGIFSVPASGVVQLASGASGTPASAVLFAA